MRGGKNATIPSYKGAKMKCDFPRSEYEHYVSECGFTDEELQVLNLRRRGWYLVDIAAELNVSVRTVKRRSASITNKIKRL